MSILTMTILSIVGGGLALIVVFAVIALREWRKRAALEKRFSVVVDADAEAKRIVEEAERSATKREALATRNVEMHEKDATAAEVRLKGVELEIQTLRDAYHEKKAIYDRLSHEVAMFDERIAFTEMGVYEPHFDFDTSEQFKNAIELVRTKQKALMSGKSAVICTTQWQVDGSVAKGRTMTERNIRLTLRAFNNECDAAIANTRWNNANAMEKRIENARRQIDKHNASNTTFITDEYFSLKLEELRLTHEYREKLKQERDERADMARAAREEQRLLREMEEAEREEAKYQKVLDKAKQEAASIVGPKLEIYSRRIEMLEGDLAAAHAKVERAKAMAEVTKCGYVYIISNIGAFGPDCVKIGLTRRLDPSDRVRELGDASVPFVFDTHAIIYSDDAPALEHALHNEFMTARINAKNMRKEFFRISLEEVEAAVKRLAPEATFFRDIEAQEYHETLALRKAHLEAENQRSESQFPSEI